MVSLGEGHIASTEILASRHPQVQACLGYTVGYSETGTQSRPSTIANSVSWIPRTGLSLSMSRGTPTCLSSASYSSQPDASIIPRALPIDSTFCIRGVWSHQGGLFMKTSALFLVSMARSYDSYRHIQTTPSLLLL